MSKREPGELYLGGQIDGDGQRTGEPVHVDADQLVTHGVIVGMTGSGKTGLGVLLLEEALAAGIPTLVIDPKGDMTNLALRFPELRPEDFQPWVSPEEARRKGVDVDALAETEAEKWREGLEGWDLDGEDIASLRDAGDVMIFTPGSGAGIPLNVLGSLRAPGLDPLTHAEVLADEVQGFVSGLLQLAGIDADPITSREHILLSNLVLDAWRRDEDLDLATLIGRIQRPPLRKLGVFDLDSFFPPDDRGELALRLNGLLASPSFEAWLQGPPMDIQQLLFAPDGGPRSAVVYLAHLSEAERRFVVTLLLSKVVTWMQGQSGTGQLRALIYMDEVYGFAPPTAEPPSKKPILTLLKQARAFGVGLVLSTQNPVDLDYKAISNAGTWFIGRLQTERDRARLLDGMDSREMDRGALDDAVAGLGKREFLLQRAGRPIERFTTRWAMTYLRGPLTRAEIPNLARVPGAVVRLEDVPRVASPRPGAPEPGAPASAASVGPPGVEDPEAPPRTSAPAPVELGANESAQPPIVARGARVAWLDPAAEWARQLGAVPDGHRWRAALGARVKLRFDERYSNTDHDELWQAVWLPLPRRIDLEEAAVVALEDRDLRESAPGDGVYVMPDAPIGNEEYFEEMEDELVDELYREEEITIYRNRSLKLYGQVGESEEAFRRRCDGVARDEADKEAADLRDKYERKLRSLQERLRKTERRVDELDDEAAARGREEWIGLAGDVLSAFLGGRRRTRSIASSVSKATRRRRYTTTVSNRLETAEDTAGAMASEIVAVEDELVEELAKIDAEWQEKAEDIEPLVIGLEKNDIDVDELLLIWVPVR